MKKICTFILVMVLSQHPMFAQFGNWGGVGSGNSTATNSIFNLNSSNENFRNANFNLRINLGNRFNFGNFDFSNLNANDCCVEQPLADIYFGYNIEAALAASALIQQAGDRALNQWFHRQHTVLKKEIEKQLWQSFSNYDDARNTYFKYHENIAVSHNHKPIKSKYNARRLDGENKRSISLKNLKLLRLRENEIILSNSVNGVPVVPKEQINVDYVINNGTINLHAKKSITMSPGFHAKPGTLFHATTGNVNSSYGNFTYNGTSLDQIQNLSELQSMWENELSTFTDIHWKHHNDYYTYLKIRSIGHITNYNDPLFVDLFNKQLANYNRYDEWKQLDLMQAYLNKIRPPLALPSGYISPKFYATPQYLENYAISHKGVGRSVFDPYYNMYGPFYQIWLAREDKQEAISQVNRYKKYRNDELNRLLNELKIEDLKFEQDYRGKMSSSEIELFETLTRDQQLKYLWSAKEAIDKTDELFSTFCEKYNGKGDAFRHAYWNALSSSRIGVGLTNLLTTRHENKPPTYPYNSKENEMDLHNNQIGRDIVWNSSLNILKDVQDALNNGELKYLTHQASDCLATFNSQLIPTNQ